MLDLSDKEFEDVIAKALDSLPPKYIEKLQNVAVIWAEEPTPDQRARLNLHGGQTLFGLYEGVPQPRRGGNSNLLLPDKITIFKLPTLATVNNLAEAKEQVRRTLWHEIAHHFGLDHQQISRLE